MTETRAQLYTSSWQVPYESDFDRFLMLEQSAENSVMEN
nr:MAG TPA: hypothetical protein [Caudoviricetes sp.]